VNKEKNPQKYSQLPLPGVPHSREHKILGLTQSEGMRPRSGFHVPITETNVLDGNEGLFLTPFGSALQLVSMISDETSSQSDPVSLYRVSHNKRVLEANLHSFGFDSDPQTIQEVKIKYSHIVERRRENIRRTSVNPGFYQKGLIFPEIGEIVTGDFASGSQKDAQRGVAD